MSAAHRPLGDGIGKRRFAGGIRGRQNPGTETGHWPCGELAHLFLFDDAANDNTKRQSPIARPGDKVQVMGAVSAMQAAWHDKPNSTAGIAARPCKRRKSLP